MPSTSRGDAYYYRNLYASAPDFAQLALQDADFRDV